MLAMLLVATEYLKFDDKTKIEDIIDLIKKDYVWKTIWVNIKWKDIVFHAEKNLDWFDYTLISEKDNLVLKTFSEELLILILKKITES